MTTRQFLSVAAHRWYVLLLGLAVTAASVLLVTTHSSQSYWARSTVTLLQTAPNPLRSEGYPLTGLASALVVRANGNPVETKTSSPDNTLYGEGVLEGSRVRIRDVGGMWTSSIPGPVIFVEAIGPSRVGVSAEIERLVDGLKADLEAIQNDLKVPTYGRIILQVSPDHPEVVSVSGQPVKAAGATLLIGLALTSLLLYAVNRRWPVQLTPVEPGPDERGFRSDEDRSEPSVIGSAR